MPGYVYVAFLLYGNEIIEAVLNFVLILSYLATESERFPIIRAVPVEAPSPTEGRGPSFGEGASTRHVC